MKNEKKQQVLSKTQQTVSSPRNKLGDTAHVKISPFARLAASQF
jgi:hypothetical protein